MIQEKTWGALVANLLEEEDEGQNIVLSKKRKRKRNHVLHMWENKTYVMGFS